METIDYNQFEESLKLIPAKKDRVMRVLVVEDDTTSQPIWDHIVEIADKNARCDWATSVAEAERKIEKGLLEGNGFDLVISDIFLSGSKTGVDLWLKFNKLLNGKMVLISGIDHLKMTKFMSSDGAPLYLKKPLVIDECVEVVHSLLHPRII